MFFFLGRAFPWDILPALYGTFLLSKTHTDTLKKCKTLLTPKDNVTRLLSTSAVLNIENVSSHFKNNHESLSSNVHRSMKGRSRFPDVVPFARVLAG